MKEQKNYKTSLCRHFMTKGYCSLYNKCRFAHGEEELRKRVDPIPEVVPPPVKLVSIYKTQLCKVCICLDRWQYYENGYCWNSYMCPFAHGQEDLKSIAVMPVKQPETDFGNADEFLFSILRSLEQVFIDKEEIKELINKGIQLVKQNALPEADQIITDIVKSKSITDKEYQQCQTILRNACALHKINYLPF